MLPAIHPTLLLSPTLGTSARPGMPVGFNDACHSWLFAIGGAWLAPYATTASPIRTHFRATTLPDWNDICITRQNGGIGGPDRNRTGNLSLAGRMLSQLSYRPLNNRWVAPHNFALPGSCHRTGIVWRLIPWHTVLRRFNIDGVLLRQSGDRPYHFWGDSPLTQTSATAYGRAFQTAQLYEALADSF